MLLKNIASLSVLNVYKAAVQFLVSILVAFYVAPAEFGLVTFSLPLITFISLLTDMGLGNAIVRERDLTRAQAGAAFSLMISAGIVCAGLLAVAAWPLASGAHLRGLPPILAALSVAIIFSISASAPRALLERNLRYQTIAAIEAVSVLAAGAASIICLLLRAGVWGFVAYHLTLQFCRMTAFFLRSRHDLAINFNWRLARSLLSFGGWILGNNLLNFAARNADNLLIGAFLGAAAVGLYGLAYQFMLIPMMTLAWPASSVLFATLSRRTGNPQQGHDMILAVMAGTAALAFPVMAYLMFGLRYPVEHWLSADWRGVADIVFWLAPVGALQAIAVYNGPVLLSLGAARLQFLITVLNSVVLVATFIIALPFGLMWLVRGYAATASLMALALIWLTLKKGRISIYDLTRALFPGCAATAAGLILATAGGQAGADGWGHWAILTLCYAIGVLGTYALMATRLRLHLDTLLRRDA